MNAQQLVDQAIKNSKNMKPGTYKFQDFLDSGQFPSNISQVTRSNAETQFYAEVIKESVPNVVAQNKTSNTVAYYQKF